MSKPFSTEKNCKESWTNTRSFGTKIQIYLIGLIDTNESIVKAEMEHVDHPDHPGFHHC